MVEGGGVKMVEGGGVKMVDGGGVKMVDSGGIKMVDGGGVKMTEDHLCSSIQGTRHRTFPTSPDQQTQTRCSNPLERESHILRSLQ